MANKILAVCETRENGFVLLLEGADEPAFFDKFLFGDISPRIGDVVTETVVDTITAAAGDDTVFASLDAEPQTNSDTIQPEIDPTLNPVSDQDTIQGEQTNG